MNRSRRHDLSPQSLGAHDSRYLIKISHPNAFSSHAGRHRRRRAGRAACSGICCICAGIDSIILENRSQDHVIERVRAGVLEQGTVDLMPRPASATDSQREGMRARGHPPRVRRARHRIDMAGADGRPRDHHLRPERSRQGSDRRAAARPPGRCCFEVDARQACTISTARGRRVRFQHDGRRARGRRATSSPDATAFTGSAGRRFPPRTCTVYERVYPFAWLGILAERGPRRPTSSSTACTSAASRCSACGRTTVTRLYLQCAPDEDIDAVERRAHLGGASTRGWRPPMAGGRTRARSCRRASPACAASSSSPCATAACFWPATPPTSSRRRARRA